MYGKVIQLYIYMHLFFIKFFFLLGCYIILSRVLMSLIRKKIYEGFGNIFQEVFSQISPI